MVAENEIKPTPFHVQLAACVALVLFFAAVYPLWEFFFPIPMTAKCAFLIEKNPPSTFSALSEQQREATVECLYLKKKHNQKTRTVSPDSTHRKSV
jgi:hypothetical protein